MRKRFYLPLWIHKDSDNDVDGCMYFGRARHQSYQLYKDGGNFMPFSKYNMFTKPQAKQMLKHLYADHNRLIVTQYALMIGKVVNKLDKINHHLTNHIIGNMFWDWDIIPQARLEDIISSFHFDVDNNVAKFIRQHMIPCDKYDKKVQEDLAKEEKESKPMSAKDLFKWMDDTNKKADAENKKDKLMKPDYFVKTLKTDLAQLKKQE